MTVTTWALPLSIGVFAGIVLLLDAGFRIGRRNTESWAHEGTGAIEAGVFGLLGLLLALSFAAGASRLDARRQLIIEEANAIGTAYLRLDLLAAPQQIEMRKMFREYLDRRLEVYRRLPDVAAADQEMERAVGIQQRIWSVAVAASQTGQSPVIAVSLLPALNQMIDVTTSRAVARRTHLPSLILNLLVAVALLSAFLAGHVMSKRKRRSWLHILAYALSITFTIYTVIDLDDPRSGLIRLEAADNAMAKLRDSIR